MATSQTSIRLQLLALSNQLFFMKKDLDNMYLWLADDDSISWSNSDIPKFITELHVTLKNPALSIEMNYLQMFKENVNSTKISAENKCDGKSVCSPLPKSMDSKNVMQLLTELLG